MLSDKDALDEIAGLLSVPHWDIGLLSDVAFVLNETGRDVFTEDEEGVEE